MGPETVRICKNCWYCRERSYPYYCRKSAPTPHTTKEYEYQGTKYGGDVLAVWPLVCPDRDWCGDFKEYYNLGAPE